MDTKELDRIYIELQKRCDARRITKEQNIVYDASLYKRTKSYVRKLFFIKKKST